MKKSTRIIVILLLTVLVLWVATELLLPPTASRYIKQEIDKRYPQAGEVSVSVKAFPAIRLLFKQYGRLEIEARETTIEGVHFDSIKLNSDGWPDATYVATIGPEEINRFFTDAGSFLIDPKAVIEGEYLRLSGTVDVGFAMADITATGTLRADGRQVFFIPQTIDVAGVRAPEKAVESVEETMGQRPVFTVREYVPFSISSIKVYDGNLVIKGGVDLEEALDFKL